MAGESDLEGQLVLLIKSGGQHRKEVIEDLKALGLQIVCINEKKCPWADHCIRDWLVTDVVDPDLGYSLVTDWLKKHPDHVFSMVICFDEYGLRYTAKLAEKLGLRFISTDKIDIFRDKYRMREWSSHHGIPCPRYLRLNGAGVSVDTTTPGGLVQLLNQAKMNFPVVVKPTGGAGKYAVRIVHDEATLRSTIDEFVQKVASPRFCLISGSVVEMLSLMPFFPCSYFYTDSRVHKKLAHPPRRS